MLINRTEQEIGDEVDNIDLDSPALRRSDVLRDLLVYMTVLKCLTNGEAVYSSDNKIIVPGN